MDEAKKKETSKWYDSQLIILLLLFGVLGPLALPLLFKSSKFSLTQKTILTIIMLGYTGFLIWLIIQTWQTFNSSLGQLDGLLLQAN